MRGIEARHISIRPRSAAATPRRAPPVRVARFERPGSVRYRMPEAPFTIRVKIDDNDQVLRASGAARTRRPGGDGRLRGARRGAPRRARLSGPRASFGAARVVRGRPARAERRTLGTRSSTPSPRRCSGGSSSKSSRGSWSSTPRATSRSSTTGRPRRCTAGVQESPGFRGFLVSKVPAGTSDCLEKPTPDAILSKDGRNPTESLRGRRAFLDRCTTSSRRARP